MLLQLLTAVEMHHIEWYDATDGALPIEPADQALWDKAAEIRQAVGHPLQRYDRQKLRDEILSFVKETKAHMSMKTLEAAFAEYPPREVKRAIRTLVERGDLNWDLNWNIGQSHMVTR